MLKKGYSLQQIAKAAGHSQIFTTLRYTHRRAEDAREALERGKIYENSCNMVEK